VRLIATKASEKLKVAVRTSLVREAGFMRSDDSKWQTISDVDLVMVAVPSASGGGIDIYCFERNAQLPGNPYDGHTLRVAIEGTERLTGRQIERAYVDKGYRGHDAPNPHRVFISRQKRGVFGAIKRELRRRSAIEPVIGHMKAEGHLGCCYLKGTAGDAANAILTAVGHNLRLVLAWLRILLRLILIALWRRLAIHPTLKLAS
jgi:hypothetical protein